MSVIELCPNLYVYIKERLFVCILLNFLTDPDQMLHGYCPGLKRIDWRSENTGCVKPGRHTPLSDFKPLTLCDNPGNAG